MMLTEDLLLDIEWTGDERDAIFEYTRFGEVTPVMGVVHYVPEPATIILLAAGAWLLTRGQSISL